MRSIIFTDKRPATRPGNGFSKIRDKALRSALVAPVAALFVFASSGGVLADPSYGCFTRDYSDAHLAKHPAQIVNSIRLKLMKQPQYGEWIGLMDVKTANQGHVQRSGHGGQTFTQFLICWDQGGKRGCSVECDGGSFDITRDDGKVLDLRTRYLMVGETDECGGAVDLAEENYRWVTYRLMRAADVACADM